MIPPREISGGFEGWARMLRARPVRNSAARVESDSASGVCLRVTTRRPRFWVPPLSWIVALRPARTVVLDRLGAQLWRLCDGTRTVEDVVDRFRDLHGLSFHEARVAVTQYIRWLTRRGVLAIVMPEPGPAAARSPA